MRILIVVKFLFLLASSASFAGVEFDSSIDTQLRLRFEKEYVALIREFSRKFGVRGKDLSLNIRVQQGNAGTKLGRYSNGLILFNSALGSQTFSSVARHEISHALFSSVCPVIKDPLVHEVFSLWFSKDYYRFLSATEFLSKSSAKDYITQNISSKKIGPRFQAALSRLLVRSEMGRSLTEYYKGLVNGCMNKGKAKGLVQREVLGKIRSILSESPRVHFEAPDIVVVDGLTDEVLFKSGLPNKKRYVGSVLKPIVLSQIPSMRREMVSGQHRQWACPLESDRKVRRNWHWTEALAKSCNGFFLDQVIKESDLNSFAKLIGRYSKSRVIPSMASFIGLVENIEMSPRQIVSLYKVLSLASPGVVDALGMTAKIGTLSLVDGRNWFVRKGIRLKTGTVRSSEGHPIHSWIIAIGPQSIGGSPSFIAAIHGKGHPSAPLLQLLKKSIERAEIESIVPVSVQILGLVDLNKLKFSCGKGQSYRLRENGEVDVIAGGQGLREDQGFFCDVGPVSIQFPLRNGEQKKRDYWGAIKVTNRNSFDFVANSRNLSQRRIKARRGSLVRFQTSLRHYIERVLLSEYPHGSLETMKLLALAIKNNVQFQRHSRGPICDTTHCQVFNLNGGVAKRSVIKKIRRAISSVIHLNLETPEGSRPWIPFALGGTKPWSSQRRIALVENYFGVASLEKIEKDGSHLVLQGAQTKRLKCERLRNRLKLLSCPSRVKVTSKGIVEFFGEGEGHGLGIDLKKSDLLARGGYSLDRLQKYFFPHLVIRK